MPLGMNALMRTNAAVRCQKTDASRRGAEVLRENLGRVFVIGLSTDSPSATRNIRCEWS